MTRYLCPLSGWTFHADTKRGKHWIELKSRKETKMSKRWMMSIIYRTDNGPVVVDYDMDEIEDADGIVERGPDWRAIMDITIQLNEPDESVVLCAPLEENPDYDPENT
jgi:ribose 5-phosphate isomerase